MNTILKTINLQLFAVQTTELNSTGNDLSPEMKTYYDMNLIRAAGPNLVHAQFAQKRTIPPGGGKTVEFRRFSHLPKAMQPLTEGVTPAGNKLDVQKVTATVKQYGDYITQSDLLELTAIDNTIREAALILGDQAGRTLDAVIRNALQAGTNVSYASKWDGTTETVVEDRSELDATATLHVSDVFNVATKLRAANAPTIDGDYVAIIHPYVAGDLMRDPEWIEVHKYAAPDNIYTGEIGKLAGVRFVATSEAKIYRGEDLGASTYALTVASFSGKTITVTETMATGRLKSGDHIYVGANYYTVDSVNESGKTITIKETPTTAPTTGNKVYPGEGAPNGLSVFGCLFLGKDAYGDTEVEGGGLETIVKQKGSAGSADPLNQRSSIGWKGLKTAEILLPEYLVRLECVSKSNPNAAGN